jgi:hypothetical protein
MRFFRDMRFRWLVAVLVAALIVAMFGANEAVMIPGWRWLGQ